MGENIFACSTIVSEQEKMEFLLGRKTKRHPRVLFLKYGIWKEKMFRYNIIAVVLKGIVHENCGL